MNDVIGARYLLVN